MLLSSLQIVIIPTFSSSHIHFQLFLFLLLPKKKKSPLSSHPPISNLLPTCKLLRTEMLHFTAHGPSSPLSPNIRPIRKPSWPHSLNCIHSLTMSDHFYYYCLVHQHLFFDPIRKFYFTTSALLISIFTSLSPQSHTGLYSKLTLLGIPCLL